MPSQGTKQIGVGEVVGTLLGVAVFVCLPVVLILWTLSLEAAHKDLLQRSYPTAGLAMGGDKDGGAPRASQETPLIVDPGDTGLTLACPAPGRAAPGDATIYFSRYPEALGGTVQQLNLRNLVQCKPPSAAVSGKDLQWTADEVLPVLRRMGRGAERFLWPRVVHYRVVLDPKSDTPPSVLPAALEVRAGLADRIRDLLFKLASLGWLVGYFYLAFVRSGDWGSGEREDLEMFFRAAGVIGSAVLLFMPVLDTTASSTSLGWAMGLIGYRPVELTDPLMTFHWLGPIMIFALPMCTLGHLLSSLVLVLIRYGISLGAFLVVVAEESGRIPRGAERGGQGAGCDLRDRRWDHAGAAVRHRARASTGARRFVDYPAGVDRDRAVHCAGDYGRVEHPADRVRELPQCVCDCAAAAGALDWLTGQPGVWSTLLWPVAMYAAIRLGLRLRHALHNLRNAKAKVAMQNGP